MSGIDLYAGQTLRLHRYNLQRGDHRSELTSSTLTIADTAGRRGWDISGSVGTHNLTLTANGASQTVEVRVIAAPTWESQRVLFIGDSTTVANHTNADNPTQGGFVKVVKDTMGDACQLVGTQTTGSYVHEGTGGATYNTFNSSGSPLWNGGAAFDLEGYALLCGGRPDRVILGLSLINDVTVGIGAARTADEQADLSYADALAIINAIVAAWPSCRIAMVLPFGRRWDVSTEVREYTHRLRERMVSDFASNSNVHLIAGHASLDPDVGWLDDKHPFYANHQRTAVPILGWLAADNSESLPIGWADDFGGTAGSTIAAADISDEWIRDDWYYATNPDSLGTREASHDEAETVNGRLRLRIQDNTGNSGNGKSLVWRTGGTDYYGGVLYKVLTPPFDVALIGCRVASQSDPTTLLSSGVTSSEYMFIGLALRQPGDIYGEYEHCVVGYRAGTETLEWKRRVGATNVQQGDVGAFSWGDPVADVRVAVAADGTRTWYYRQTGTTPWTEMTSGWNFAPEPDLRDADGRVAVCIACYAFDNSVPDAGYYIDEAVVV